MADCPLCWEQPGKPSQDPQGGCLSVPVRVRRGQAAGNGWHCKLQVALPCQMVSGWRWQITCLGQPCPLCAPGMEQWAGPEHFGRQLGTRWAAPWGAAPAQDSVPLLAFRGNISWRKDDSDIKIQHRFKNNTTPKVCFLWYRCSGLILRSPEHNLLCRNHFTVQLLPLRISLWPAGTHSEGERHGLMYLPVIWGDAADWPSVRLPALLATPRAWPQVSGCWRWHGAGLASAHWQVFVNPRRGLRELRVKQLRNAWSLWVWDVGAHHLSMGWGASGGDGRLSPSLHPWFLRGGYSCF